MLAIVLPTFGGASVGSVSEFSGSQPAREDDGTWTATWPPFTLRSAFQPIFRFDAGKLAVTGFECLLRPFRDGQVQSPASFLAGLSAAERVHVEALSRSLHLSNAADCLPADTTIFLNFDPSVFADHAAAAATVGHLRRTSSELGIYPNRLVCEVTEIEAVSEAALADFVSQLKQSGFRVAVDDYGADASDMHRITRLQPDIVKFDGAMMQRLMETAAGYGLLKAMVSTFSVEGILTVFEGVEKHEQIELAEQSGVAMVQGFALARPELAPGRFSFSCESAQVETRPGHVETVGYDAGGRRQTHVFGKRARPS